MNNPILFPTIVVATSYVILGILFCICIRLFSSSGQKMTLLKEVTTLASLSIDQRFPRVLPEERRQLVHKLTHEMLRELDHSIKEWFTIDALIETSMHRIDTQARLTSISMNEVQTQIMRAQNTDPIGTRQIRIASDPNYRSMLTGK